MITTTTLTILFLRKKLTLKFDLGMIVQTLAAGVIMATVVMAVQIQFYSQYLLPLYLVIGAVVYILALRLLKAVKQEDIDLVRRHFGHRPRFAPRMLSWNAQWV